MRWVHTCFLSSFTPSWSQGRHGRVCRLCSLLACNRLLLQEIADREILIACCLELISIETTDCCSGVWLCLLCEVKNYFMDFQYLHKQLGWACVIEREGVSPCYPPCAAGKLKALVSHAAARRIGAWQWCSSGWPASRWAAGSSRDLQVAARTCGSASPDAVSPGRGRGLMQTLCASASYTACGSSLSEA